MYTAMEISRYVINKCAVENHPISNLQLQKILYYIQRDFLQSGSIAFSDDIEAWQFGPVVPSVYHCYCGFGSLPIRVRYTDKPESFFCSIIDPIVEQKRLLNPWDLVRDTHNVGRAWALIYRDGLGDHQVIPKALIRERG